MGAETTAVSAAAPLPRRQAPSGRSELVSEINVSQSADPQVLRLSSLWDICSATLASADQSRHAK
jgi:hypothetical protein